MCNGEPQAESTENIERYPNLYGETSMLNEKEQRKVVMAALLMLEQTCPYWEVYASPVLAGR